MASSINPQSENSLLTYFNLRRLFEDQPLLRLFRRQDPALVISVLYELFKSRERLMVPYQDAVVELGLFLDDLNQEDAEQPNSMDRQKSSFRSGAGRTTASCAAIWMNPACRCWS